MSDLTEFVFGFILWLVSCSFIFTVYSNQSKIQAESNYQISQFPPNENDKLVRENSVNQVTEEELQITSIKTENNDEETKQIKKELGDKIEELELANKTIEALQKELESQSQELDLLKKKGKQIKKEFSQNSEKFKHKIADLEQECRELKEYLEKQETELNFEFQANAFDELHSLLTSYPTAKIMIKIKPNLPAKNLVALFKPLDNLLNSWNITKIGQPWEQVPYNPQLHQPDNNDIAEGELVYIRFIGYSQGDRIIYPAKVSRTLPGNN